MLTGCDQLVSNENDWAISLWAVSLACDLGYQWYAYIDEML